MVSAFFRDQMTLEEAQSVFFKAIDGKPEEEIKEIRAAFFEVIAWIAKQEINLAQKGWL